VAATKQRAGQLRSPLGSGITVCWVRRKCSKQIPAQAIRPRLSDVWSCDDAPQRRRQNARQWSPDAPTLQSATHQSSAHRMRSDLAGVRHGAALNATQELQTDLQRWR